jgi:uncharacterized protein (TIGR02145 family)
MGFGNRRFHTLFLASVLCLAPACLSGCGSNAVSEKSGTFTDARDDKEYRTIKIGTQTWMAENLNYETDSSWCWWDSVSYCGKYGRLYSWNAAMSVCPSGWYLPSSRDWGILLARVMRGRIDRGSEDFTVCYGAGKKLKAKSGWSNYKNIWTNSYSRNGNGTDDYDFSALPGGARNRDGWFYGGNGRSGHWWTATKIADSKIGGEARNLDMSNDVGYVIHSSTPTSHGLSVRCVRD